MTAPRASSGMLRSRLRSGSSTLMPSPTLAPPTSPLARSPAAAPFSLFSTSTSAASTTSVTSSTTSLSSSASTSPSPALTSLVSSQQVRHASSSGGGGKMPPDAAKGDEGKDNLGGPGGQQPAPQKPSGGPDTMKRNWLPISGAALLAVGMYAYLTGGGPPSAEKQKKLERKVARGKEQMTQKLEEGMDKMERKYVEGKQATQRELAKRDQLSSKSLAEVSGRKGDMGGFRNE